MRANKEMEYDFLKTIYQAKLNDRKYFEDKALTLIQTNGILIVILSGLLGVILPADIEIDNWILFSVLVVLLLYLASTICAIRSIYPRELDNQESKLGIPIGENDSQQFLDMLINRLKGYLQSYEEIVLPTKAMWIPLVSKLPWLLRLGYLKEWSIPSPKRLLKLWSPTKHCTPPLRCRPRKR